MLIEKAELKAMIAMPSGVFKPYAGVSTAILIFTKGGETNRVWFYDMQADGYTLDDKRNKIDASDLPDIVAQFKARNKQKENDREAKYFFIPKAEIIENDYDLSISKYKEEVYEEVVYEESSVIIEKLKALESKINEGILDIETIFDEVE
jgi:type I restriction enzyme M protein